MQDNRKKLFADNPTQETVVNIEKPLLSNPDYFKNIPTPLLLCLAWFSYKAITSIYSIFALRLMLFENPQPPVERLFTIAFPLLLLVAYWLIAWGLIKQMYWTKMVLVLWYIIFWLYVCYRLYPVLSLSNSYESFFYQLQGNTYLLAFLLPIILELVIDSSIIYYLFKKVSFTNR